MLKRSVTALACASPVRSDRRPHAAPYLLKCYDYCIDVAVPPDSDRPGAAYKWADIGYNSPSDGQGSVCGHSEVPCYCATACPETFGGSQGLIAGPCDADEPLKKVGTGGAESRETAPPAPEE